MELRIPLAALLCALAFPAIAAAQGFDFGLDLTEETTPPPKAPSRPTPRPPASRDLAASDALEADLVEGPTVVAVPSGRADGGPDVPTYKVLHAGLAERLGARLVDVEATLAAIESERLDRAALATTAGRERLAAAVRAEKVIAFSAAPALLEARLFADPGDHEAAVHKTYSWTRRNRVDRARGRVIAKELLDEGRQALAPAPAPAVQVASILSPPEASGTSAPQDLDAMLRSDIDSEERRERPSTPARASGPLKEPRALILIGAGASLRSLEATSQSSIVPQIPGAMTGLSVDLVVHPLRLVPSLAESWLAGFSVSGDYRRALTSAQIGDDGESCAVDDDAIVARLSYRHKLGERLPRVGLGLGWASERVNFHCQEPVLSTKYNTIETRLEVAQPLLGEQLGLEVAGGPRFVVSETGEGSENSAFAVEGWLSYRPQPVLYVRGGVRITSTKVNTLPENVPTSDMRTFVGVQVGAAL